MESGIEFCFKNTFFLFKKILNRKIHLWIGWRHFQKFAFELYFLRGFGFPCLQKHKQLFCSPKWDCIGVREWIFAASHLLASHCLSKFWLVLIWDSCWPKEGSQGTFPEGMLALNSEQKQTDINLLKKAGRSIPAEDTALLETLQ